MPRPTTSRIIESDEEDEEIETHGQQQRPNTSTNINTKRSYRISKKQDDLSSSSSSSSSSNSDTEDEPPIATTISKKRFNAKPTSNKKSPAATAAANSNNSTSTTVPRRQNTSIITPPPPIKSTKKNKTTTITTTNSNNSGIPVGSRGIDEEHPEEQGYRPAHLRSSAIKRPVYRLELPGPSFRSQQQQQQQGQPKSEFNHPHLWSLRLPASSIKRKLSDAMSYRYKEASHDLQLNMPFVGGHRGNVDENLDVIFRLQQIPESSKRMLMSIPEYESTNDTTSTTADASALSTDTRPVILLPLQTVGYMIPSFAQYDNNKQQQNNTHENTTSTTATSTNNNPRPQKRAAAKAVTMDKLNSNIRLTWSQVHQLHERGQWNEGDGAPELGNGSGTNDQHTWTDLVIEKQKLDLPEGYPSNNINTKVAVNPHYWDEIVPPPAKSHMANPGDDLLTIPRLRSIRDVSTRVGEVILRRGIVPLHVIKNLITGPTETNSWSNHELLQYALKYAHIVGNYLVVKTDPILYNTNINKLERRALIEEREKEKLKVLKKKNYGEETTTANNSSSNNVNSSSTTTTMDTNNIAVDTDYLYQVKYPLRRHEMFAHARDLILSLFALHNYSFPRDLILPSTHKNSIPDDILTEALQSVAVFRGTERLWAIKYYYDEDDDEMIHLQEEFLEEYENELKYWSDTRVRILINLDRNREALGVMQSVPGRGMSSSSSSIKDNNNNNNSNKKHVSFAGESHTDNDNNKGDQGTIRTGSNSNNNPDTSKGEKTYHSALKKFVLETSADISIASLLNGIPALTRDETVETLRRVYATKGISKDKVEEAKRKLTQQITKEPSLLRNALDEYFVHRTMKSSLKKAKLVEQESQSPQQQSQQKKKKVVGNSSSNTTTKSTSSFNKRVKIAPPE
jgi:hypothetical protein